VRLGHSKTGGWKNLRRPYNKNTNNNNNKNSNNRHPKYLRHPRASPPDLSSEATKATHASALGAHCARAARELARARSERKGPRGVYKEPMCKRSECGVAKKLKWGTCGAVAELLGICINEQLHSECIRSLYIVHTDLRWPRGDDGGEGAQRVGSRADARAHARPLDGQRAHRE
jgi:hypothetical protein